MNEARSARAGTSIRSKVLGIFGGTSSSLGAFGAVHSACHYTCQAIVALLAIAGISVAAMPLAFLLDPRLVVLFSALGLVSVVLGGVFRFRLHKRFDRKVALFALFAIVSATSLAFGIHDLVAKQDVALAAGVAGTPSSSVDAAAKTNNQGEVTIEIIYQGISDETLEFRVAMDATKMDLPPLTQYDLVRLSRLTQTDGTQVRPARWMIEQAGHMGHHLRGTLVFPLRVDHRPVIDPRTKGFEIVVSDVGGVRDRVFAWKIVPYDR